MSLIKIALIGTLLQVKGGAALLGQTIHHATSASYGSPLKYFTTKVNNSIPLLGRKSKIEMGLGTVAHTLRRVRDNGKVLDATSMLGGSIEGMIGSPVHGQLARYTDFRAKLPYFSRQTLDNASELIVDKNGKIQAHNIEKILKIGKKVHVTAAKLDTNTLPITTAAIGGIHGAKKSYDNNKNSIIKDNNAVIKGFAKGAIKGSVVGFAVKKAANVVKDKTLPLLEAHNSYFTDNYWRDRIKGANKSIVGKLGGRIFTTNKDNREYRMAKALARKNVFEHKLFGSGDDHSGGGTLKDKWKKYREVGK